MLVIMMKLQVSIFVLATFTIVWSYPTIFEKKNFKVGIEYDHSLPMSGGSDRYRHRNNWDPFFVTVTASAKKGYVISYLEVSASVDEGGDVTFNMIRGKTGSNTMVFQLVSNKSDFLSYSYMAYGIKEEEYKKITNIISIPMNPMTKNHGKIMGLDLLTFVMFGFLYPLLAMS